MTYEQETDALRWIAFTCIAQMEKYAKQGVREAQHTLDVVSNVQELLIAAQRLREEQSRQPFRPYLVVNNERAS